MEAELITQLNHDVLNDMKAGNLLWDEIIDSGSRYVQTLKSTLAAHSMFVERLAKLANFSASSGMIDLANGLQQLIMAEKDFAKSQATKVSTLDNVIEPLGERLTEWRKNMPQQARPAPLPNRSRLLRKGSSTENLINKMGSVMTLSRKSRKPSRDRKQPEPEEPIQLVGRETLIATTTEAQARISIFARSMTPYIKSHGDVARSAELISTTEIPNRINKQSVNHWVDGRLRDMSNFSFRRHQRKSSISSISSSKSDSNSSGSANPTAVEVELTRAASSMASDYRLSTTSHDSGFTSHEQISIERSGSLPRPSTQQKLSVRQPHHKSTHAVPQYNNEQFNLPAPPPELLMGISSPVELNVSCPNLDSGPQSPSARSTGSSAASSVPLSPYMTGQQTVIESGLATIRRNPSKLTRLGSLSLTQPRIPSIPSSPAKPPLPPKRQGSTLSQN